eukprot:gnl/Chilomastix_cuspidata/2985.p1 GENE.gnl/Chilomastix_cuspidata/2985~~gnl/Chilomastix_cuspidata/2985.p1  ORF type:complete len:1006 (-),score=284.62 gnl/Chilomastix_cuspidata/2985:218-3196(-)
MSKFIDATYNALASGNLKKARDSLAQFFAKSKNPPDIMEAKFLEIIVLHKDDRIGELRKKVGELLEFSRKNKKFSHPHHLSNGKAALLRSGISGAYAELAALARANMRANDPKAGAIQRALVQSRFLAGDYSPEALSELRAQVPAGGVETAALTAASGALKMCSGDFPNGERDMADAINQRSKLPPGASEPPAESALRLEAFRQNPRVASAQCAWALFDSRIERALRSAKGRAAPTFKAVRTQLRGTHAGARALDDFFRPISRAFLLRTAEPDEVPELLREFLRADPTNVELHRAWGTLEAQSLVTAPPPAAEPDTAPDARAVAICEVVRSTAAGRNVSAQALAFVTANLHKPSSFLEMREFLPPRASGAALMGPLAAQFRALMGQCDAVPEAEPMRAASEFVAACCNYFRACRHFEALDAHFSDGVTALCRVSAQFHTRDDFDLDILGDALGCALLAALDIDEAPADALTALLEETHKLLKHERCLPLLVVAFTRALEPSTSAAGCAELFGAISPLLPCDPTGFCANSLRAAQYQNVTVLPALALHSQLALGTYGRMWTPSNGADPNAANFFGAASKTAEEQQSDSCALTSLASISRFVGDHRSAAADEMMVALLLRSNPRAFFEAVWAHTRVLRDTAALLAESVHAICDAPRNSKRAAFRNSFDRGIAAEISRAEFDALVELPLLSASDMALLAECAQLGHGDRLLGRREASLKDVPRGPKRSVLHCPEVAARSSLGLRELPIYAPPSPPRVASRNDQLQARIALRLSRLAAGPVHSGDAEWAGETCVAALERDLGDIGAACAEDVFPVPLFDAQLVIPAARLLLSVGTEAAHEPHVADLARSLTDAAARVQAGELPVVAAGLSVRVAFAALALVPGEAVASPHPRARPARPKRGKKRRKPAPKPRTAAPPPVAVRKPTKATRQALEKLCALCTALRAHYEKCFTEAAPVRADVLPACVRAHFDALWLHARELFCRSLDEVIEAVARLSP